MMSHSRRLQLLNIEARWLLKDHNWVIEINDGAPVQLVNRAKAA